MSSRPVTRSPVAAAQARAHAHAHADAQRAVLEELAERARSAELEALHLERALASNRRIGIAVGLLMCHYRLSPDQGIDLLRRISQERNVKVRELAEEVIDDASRWSGSHPADRRSRDRR
ncbi:ANTAR domain-containing protein [Nocardioides sp. CFH 31398]|uniref:ANTAR domain-containing protein n=1 Tax=Nocardioides sp. CFH 31398 TaxID=2919579 RepID=UPI001F063F66|nr:ANTAR domain-containing protein [Nocardioides sp. CFH 31398]MCH1866532.1 ANTAR domain-containing protein [Nocardioides sp. CFH 31398]